MGIADKIIDIEQEFWKMLGALEKNVENFNDFIEWWVKLICHLEKEETQLVEKKRKKLRKLLIDDKEKLRTALQRFDEHLLHFEFKQKLANCCVISCFHNINSSFIYRSTTVLYV